MVKPQKTHTHKSYRSHKSHKARLENKKKIKNNPHQKNHPFRTIDWGCYTWPPFTRLAGRNGVFAPESSRLPSHKHCPFLAVHEAAKMAAAILLTRGTTGCSSIDYSMLLDASVFSEATCLMNSHEISWTVFQVFSQYPDFGSETSSYGLAGPSIIQVQLCQILGQGIATFTAFQLCELPHLFTSCGRTAASGTAGDQAIWYHKNWTVSSWSEISGWKTHCPCIERLTCRTTNWHGTSTGRNHEVWWEDRSWCLQVYLQSSFWSLISILIDTHDQFGEALLTPKSGWTAYTSGFSIFNTIW